MGKVYKGQTALTITATVGQDVTSATCLIKYKKPDETLGSFAATIITAVTGVIRYTITSASDIDQAGNWVFWTQVTFSDGTIANGEEYVVTIYDTIG